MKRRNSVLRSIRSVSFAACAAAVLLFGGCQAMFTYSPLSGLQQSPSQMSKDQRLAYAKDALASGDTAAMKKAYDAIKGDSGADAEYTTAQLGIEISGVPTVLVQIAEDPSSDMSTQLADINTFIAANHLDPSFMVAAAGQLSSAQADGAVLTDMDQAMGAIGFLLEGAKTQSGGASWNIVTGNPDKAAAGAFLAPAVTDVQSLSSSDPQRQFIEALNTYISGL